MIDAIRTQKLTICDNKCYQFLNNKWVRVKAPSKKFDALFYEYLFDEMSEGKLFSQLIPENCEKIIPPRSKILKRMRSAEFVESWSEMDRCRFLTLRERLVEIIQKFASDPSKEARSVITASRQIKDRMKEIIDDLDKYSVTLNVVNNVPEGMWDNAPINEYYGVDGKKHESFFGDVLKGEKQ